MVVGVCSIEITLATGNSLKEKRKIVNSIKDRIRKRYNVSIIEVANHDSLRNISIGIACVSNSDVHARNILAKIANFIGENYPYLTFDYEVEVL